MTSKIVWNSRQPQDLNSINRQGMNAQRNIVGRQVMMLRSKRNWSQEKFSSV
jgi:hypothetical protein